jgi:hypothetical protein
MTLPLAKTGYLNNAGLRSKGILWSQHFTMADNPNLTAEFIQSQRQLYTGFFYKRFIEGLWVVAEGSIYKDSWSEAVAREAPTVAEFSGVSDLSGPIKSCAPVRTQLSEFSPACC